MRSIKTSSMALAVLLTFLLFAVSCDDSESYYPFYPLPDSGSTVEIDCGLQLLESESNSYIRIKVLEQGSQLINAEVFFDGNQLEYNNLNRCYFLINDPPLLPGTLHRLRVRQEGWGEDSTLFRIADDFELENLALMDTLHYGESRTFSWTNSEYSEFYRVTIAKISQTTEYEYYDSLTTNSFTWIAPDSGFSSATVTLDAVIKYSEDDVFFGETRCSLFGQFFLKE